LGCHFENVPLHKQRNLIRTNPPELRIETAKKPLPSDWALDFKAIGLRRKEWTVKMDVKKVKKKKYLKYDGNEKLDEIFTGGIIFGPVFAVLGGYDLFAKIFGYHGLNSNKYKYNNYTYYDTCPPAYFKRVSGNFLTGIYNPCQEMGIMIGTSDNPKRINYRDAEFGPLQREEKTEDEITTGILVRQTIMLESPIFSGQAVTAVTDSRGWAHVDLSPWRQALTGHTSLPVTVSTLINGRKVQRKISF
jgi:hypothetical protein